MRGREHTGTSTRAIEETPIESGKNQIEEMKDMKVTWAEVVKRSTVRKAPNVENNGFVSRSFSRNNPVNRT